MTPDDDRKSQPVSPGQSRLDRVLLASLLVIAILTGLYLTRQGGQVQARLLFQSQATDTPDPNSPQPTPTDTATPTAVVVPSDTPVPTVTPFPTDTPAVPPPPAPPTDTPVFIEPTAAPTFTPAFIEPTAAPTFTPGLIVPTPTPPPSPEFPTLAPPMLETATSTPTPLVLLVQPVQPEGEQQPAAAGLDLALLIDNMVVAFGYVWLCCGALIFLGALVGAVWLWRRGNRPSGDAGSASRPTPPPVPPQQPAAAGPATSPEPPPARPPRVAARHDRQTLDDVDQSPPAP